MDKDIVDKEQLLLKNQTYEFHLGNYIRYLQEKKGQGKDLKNDNQFVLEFNRFLELFKEVNTFVKNELSQKSEYLYIIMNQEGKQKSDEIQEINKALYLFFQNIDQGEMMVHELLNFKEQQLRPLNERFKKLIVYLNKHLVPMKGVPVSSHTKVEDWEHDFRKLEKQVKTNLHVLTVLQSEIHNVKIKEIALIHFHLKKLLNKHKFPYFQNLGSKLLDQIKVKFKKNQKKFENLEHYLNGVFEQKIVETILPALKIFQEDIQIKLGAKIQAQYDQLSKPDKSKQKQSYINKELIMRYYSLIDPPPDTSMAPRSSSRSGRSSNSSKSPPTSSKNSQNSATTSTTSATRCSSAMTCRSTSTFSKRTSIANPDYHLLL